MPEGCRKSARGAAKENMERRRKGRDRGDRKGNKITTVLGNARGAS